MRGKNLFRLLIVFSLASQFCGFVLAETSKLSEELQPEFGGEPQQELYLDSDGKPRFHLYNGEEVAILSSNNSRTMVMQADSQFSRNLYDKEYRLTSRLTWVNKATTSSTATVVKAEEKTPEKENEEEKSPPMVMPPELAFQEDYYYYENSRIKQKVVLTNFLDKSRLESYYSSEGLVTKEEVFTFLPDESEDKDLENKKKSENKKQTEEKDKSVEQSDKESLEQSKDNEPNDLVTDPWKDFPELTLTSVTEYKYNDEGVLTEKISTAYYREETESGYSKQKSESSKKSKKEFPRSLKKTVQRVVYQTPGNIYGGYDLFEDGELLISRKYNESGQYLEIRYIDTMKIETLYEGARLLSEVIYLDGKELRRTEY